MEVLERTEIAKSIDIVWNKHPVTPVVGRETLIATALEGRTIREVLIASGVDTHQEIVIRLDDRLLTVKEWDIVCPRAGQLITVTATVSGGGGGGSDAGQILMMVAVVALAIAAPYLAPAALGATATVGTVTTLTMTGSLISAGVMIAGTLLMGAIFAPAAPNNEVQKTESASPTYSLSGGQNNIRPFESMPVVMGYHKLTPDLGARPFTEYIDNDQYLYQIFHFGLSDIEITDYKLGTTPITSYTDYVWSDPNASGQLTTFPGNVDSAPGTALTNSAGWIERTTSQDSYRVGIDIAGVFFYANDRGGLDYASATVEIEYKEISSGTWLAGGTYTLGGSTQTPLRRTFFIDLPSVGTYNVRVRRVTADATDSRTQNKTNYDVIRSYQLDNSSYVGQRRRGITIRASEQLSGAIQQLTVLANASANYWNGTAWVYGTTDNPAHWFMDFAKGRLDSNGKIVYGIALSDSQIDLEGLHAWAQFCATENLTFNAVIDSRQTAAELINTIARCGFGSPTWASGKLGVVFDGRNQTPVAAFGMSNIIKGTFEVAYVTEQLADEIIVGFINPDKDWSADEVRVTVPTVVDPLRSTTVQLFGCTNQAMAGKFANYLAAQQYYRTRRITWETDFEGFVCQRGDVVLLSHDLTQWGYSGRIVEVTNLEALENIEDVVEEWGDSYDLWQGGDVLVRLDRPVPRNGNIETLGIRTPDGDIVYYQALPASEESDLVRLVISPDVDRDFMFIDHLWFFSPLPTPGKKVKIISIQPVSDSRIRITATDENPEFYLAWDGVFNEVPQSTLLLNSVPSIDNPQISELVYRGANGNVQSLITVAFQAKNFERANIKWRINGGVWNKTTIYTNTFKFTVELTGDLEVDILPINGTTIGASVLATSFVFGLQTSQPPPDLTNIITTYNGAGGQIVLNWSAVNDFRQPNIQYEIRLGVSWESGAVLGRTPLTQFVAQGDGKYWVAAVYINQAVSIYSENPISLDVVGATLQNNVIASYDESVDWLGAVAGSAEISGSVLQLENDGVEVTGLSGSYTIPDSHIIDAGRVTACNVSISVVGGGVAVDDNILDSTNVLTLTDVLNAALGTQVIIQPQIAIGNGAGVYGDWQNFLPGYYKGRYFKARVLISTSDASINVLVADFIFSVDVPDRVDTGQQVTATGGSTVSYSSPFLGGATGLSIPNVQLTIVNAQSGDDIILTNESLSGFDIQILNGGSGVIRTVNWLAQGY